jgi:hypothetical protein
MIKHNLKNQRKQQFKDRGSTILFKEKMHHVTIQQAQSSKSKGFVSSMGTAYDVIYSSILFRKKFCHVVVSAISKLNQTKEKGLVSFNMINVVII